MGEKFDVNVDKEGNIPIDIIHDGCVLGNDWTLSSIGIFSGEILRAFERQEKRVILYVYSAFNEKVYQIYDAFDFQKTSISHVRSIISRHG